ncbi:MAG: RNA-binding cell elongation regulator Jag/EloR [Candidatus Cloacimonadales bacterium]|nr:RNA-binding cell elongation regulator Jag/EloR [Candidatus Cloacimonadales bacterium]
MRTVIKEGKSTSAVISEFMKESNLKLDEFKFEVMEEGSKGLLGLFGAKPTKVKITLPDVTEKIKEFVEGILQRIDAKYTSITVNFKDHVYQVDIRSEDPGFIIGKDAKMLDSLQHLLNQMINKQEKKQLKLKVDVDGYRQRRQDALLDKVKDISEKVKEHGRSITMEPLHAANRRLVHQYVEKDKNIRTMTIGDGEFKRVVILPANSTEVIPAKKTTSRPRPERKRNYQSTSAK